MEANRVPVRSGNDDVEANHTYGVRRRPSVC